MNFNWRYVAGLTTIVGVLGITGYSIYLYQKQKKEDEVSISVDEAMKIANRELDNHGKEKSYVLKDDLVNELNDIVRKTSVGVEVIKEAEEEVSDDQPEDEVKTHVDILKEQENILKNIGEFDDGNVGSDDKLRYDPNSNEALLQFRQMQMAEWHSEEYYYDILTRLFEYKYEPTNEGDKHLADKLMDYRSEFFGPNTMWVPWVTFADLVLYYARRAAYDLGNSVKYWAEYFIDENGIEPTTSVEELTALVDELNQHSKYHENGTYGFFGLNDNSLGRAYEAADRSPYGVIDYEISYQQFIQEWL